MDNLKWSILANLLHGGMTWASAEAYILLYYIPQAAADQADATAQMEANKTALANLVAVGAQAPGDRTASWYVQGAPFETGLPSQGGGVLPNPLAAAVGDSVVVDTDGTWTTGTGGGGGVSSIGAPVAATANGATITAGTVFHQAFASATLPGIIAAATQDFGNFNRKFWGMEFRGNLYGTLPGLSMGAGGAALVSDVGGTNLDLLLGGIGTWTVTDGTSFIKRVSLANPWDTLDLTGLGTPGKLQLKSPDGTVYTVSVANGGTLSIV